MERDLNPCTNITVDAIGKPGKRVFYIQGSTVSETISLILEKIQVQSLSASILKFLEELQQRTPELPQVSGEFNEEEMRIIPPIDPLFRVGEIGLAYDAEQDLVCLITREIILENSQPEDQNEIRYWCTREQSKALALWGLELVSRGRPICPLCGEAIDPSGHFCPKKNGHKKH